MQNPLRNIPSLGEILESPAMKSLVSKLSRGEIVSTTLNILDELRNQASIIASQRTLPSVTEVAELITKRIMQGDPSQIGPVINATGELFPETLGPPPLAGEAVLAVEALLRDYPGMGEPLSGWSARRQEMAIEKLVNKITGAEATMILNSTAAGLLLAFSTFSRGRKLVVSRSHLYESRRRRFRLPELAESVGVVMKEVGTTNRTLTTDYYHAMMHEDTGMVFYAFPGHYSINGATEIPPVTDVVKIARMARKPIFVDLGMGGLLDMDTVLGSSLPSARKMFKAGVDFVLLTCDYMMNGPGCVMLAGSREMIQHCRENPLSQAFTASPIVQTALEATLEKYATAQSMMTSVPILQLLDTSIENLRYRAERIARQLESLMIIGKVTVRTVPAQLFGGYPETPLLETVQICIHPVTEAGQSASALIGRIAYKLSGARPAIWGRLESETLVLDMRCVFPRQDALLVEAFEKLPGVNSVDL